MFKLRDYQEKSKKDTFDFIFKSNHKKGIIVKPVGCHNKGYKVFMSDGSLKKVEDISIGDKLMGDDSSDRIVTKLYNGYDHFYKLKIKNIEIFLNKDHILHLVRTGDNYKRKSIENQFPKHINISINDYLKWSNYKKSYYKISRKGFKITNDNIEIKIDPYYFGLWLGDGTSISHQIETKDIEIKNYLKKYSKKLNLLYKEECYDYKKSCRISLNIDKKIYKKNPIIQEFRKYNLYNNKHIPELFFLKNDKFKLKILSGIIDSDGYLDYKTNYEIIQKNKKLSYDIYRLCGSLGYNPIIKKIYKKCLNCENKENREYYKISFRGDNRLECLLDRKQVKKSNPNKDNSLYSFKIEYYKKDEFFGFELNNNKLYICENFIVHHNSGKALDTAIIAEMVNDDILVLQPNIELLEQNVEKARSFGLDPSIYSASANKKEVSNITYATPLSVVSNPSAFKNKKIIVIDECHLNMSNSIKNGKVSSRSKLNEFINYINPEKVIGLTASPIQLVTTRMGSELKMLNRSMRSFWYKSNIFHITQINEIHEKYWANIKTEIVDNDINVLTRLRDNSPEFTDQSIINQYEENNFKTKILDNYENLLYDGKKSILTFVPSVKQAIELSNHNKEFAVVYDKTPKKERKAIVEAFKRGDIPMLINCQVFTAGFDHPQLDGLIMARDTMSYQLYYQIYGRIVRPIIENGNIIKKEGTIVDLTGNTNRFGDPKNMTIEKNDYTNGWAMWNSDSLISGYPFGEWDMPKRESFINKKIIDKNEKIEDIILNFGKYKGKSLLDSFEKNINYFIWVRQNFDFSKKYNQELKNILDKLIDKHLAHGK